MDIKIPSLAYIYNRYGDASSKKDAVIELRITYEGKQKYMSTRVRVFPKEWKRGRIVNRPDAMILNRHLDKMLTDVREVIYDMYEKGNIDIFSIPVRMDAKRKKAGTFLDFVKKRLPIHKHGQSTLRQKAYDRFFNFLEEYGKFRLFSDVDEHSILELDRSLQKKKMMASSRWANYHRFLNTFIRDAQKENLMTYNPYDRIRIDKGDYTDSIEKCLSPEEFEKLRTAKMPGDRLERVRDLFVFHCYLCQNYEDLQAFQMKDIKEIDGKMVYAGKRGKSKVDFIVPMLSPAIELLEKYNGKLHLISNVKYNAYLKEVAAAAGIKKHLTTHWARHTGGTLLLNAGVPMDIVSKVLGHHSIKMTERIYAKWMPKTIVNEVNKVAVKTEAKERFDKLVASAVATVKTADCDRTALVAAFNDYYDWYENEVQRENLPTFGAAPGSPQNRTVLAGQIVRAVKYGDYGLAEQQLSQLRKILSEIVDNFLNNLIQITQL